MSAIEWVDELPPKPHGKGKGPAYGWGAEDEVRANPGRWARVWTYQLPSSKASNAAKSARKRGFDTAVRPTAGDDGNRTGTALYLRWPAAEEAPAPKARSSRRPVGYPCDHCEEELSTPAALKVHVRKEHPEVAR